MKIKVLNLKNRIVILDNTNCVHTKSLLNSMLATLNGRKQLIDLDDVFINKFSLDPLSCHSGFKSLSNIIIPKNNGIELNKEAIDELRSLLSNFLMHYEDKNGTLNFYDILSFFQDNERIQSTYEEKANPLLVNNRYMDIVLNQLNNIALHPYVAKSNTLRAIKASFHPANFNKNEIYFLKSGGQNTNIGNTLVINTIKAVDKEGKQEASEEWKVLSSSFIDEVGLFNNSSIINEHSLRKAK